MKQKVWRIILALVMSVLFVCPAFAATTFPDMGNYSIYEKAVDYVSELGIMVGDEKGNFGPGKNVTRAEMAAILCRLMDQTEHLQPSNIFSDVPIDYWANAYINKAAELGIVKGYGNGRFGPQEPVTCEQVLTMVIRAAGREDDATGGYPDGFLDLAEQSGLTRDVNAEKGGYSSRLDIATILYNCMANNFHFPLTGYTLVDCDFYRSYYTDDPSHAYDIGYRSEYGGLRTDNRLGDAHLILIDCSLRKSTTGILYRPYFDDYEDSKFDELKRSSGKPVVGPYWKLAANNCPHGYVVGEKDNGESVHALGDELNFRLNGKYSTLEFDMGPSFWQGNSYDDVRIYLDGKEAAYYRIPYNTAAQHCTLNVTGVTTITFRVKSDPEYDPDTFIQDSNDIIICNSKLIKLPKM